MLRAYYQAWHYVTQKGKDFFFLFKFIFSWSVIYQFNIMCTYVYKIYNFVLLEYVLCFIYGSLYTCKYIDKYTKYISSITQRTNLYYTYNIHILYWPLHYHHNIKIILVINWGLDNVRYWIKWEIVCNINIAVIIVYLVLYTVA